MADSELIIGLDIGTTYTGVAFCEKCGTRDKIHDIVVIQDWPKALTQTGTSEKVPTEIAYTSKGIRWGYDIPSHVARHMWTKLQLNGKIAGEAAAIKSELPSTSEDEHSPKLPEDIIADFLKGIKQNLIKNLEKTYGVELWKSFPITLVITFPAVWSDAAKDKTMDSVNKAGFNKAELPKLKKILTVTEPEAASLFTLKSLQGSLMLDQLTVGDAFIVCDMGGGTVDLISYRITGVNPIAIEEATVGTGAQCGGSFVDRGFLSWLEKKLGPDDFAKISDGLVAEQLQRTSLPAKLGKMMQEFRSNKNGFDGTEGYIMSLQPPLTEIEDEERGMYEGELTVSEHDMSEMFQFALSQTRELNEDQLRLVGRADNTNIRYIFLVGGFASSPFMYRQLCALASGYGVQVVTPKFPWSAVVRGAVVKGLESSQEITVQARKCRRNYGTAVSTFFDKSKHLQEDMYIDEYNGTKRANHQMHWIICKGHNLQASKPNHGTHTLATRCRTKGDKTMHLTLMAADVDVAPSRSEDEDVYKVAELSVDLRSVPGHLWRKLRGMGKTYYELQVQVEFAIQSQLEYSVSVDGKRYGSIKAKYV